MNFGRKDDPAPPPPLAWQVRLQSSLQLIQRNVTDPALLRRLGEVEGALWTADTDRQRLQTAMDQLQPDRATRELKTALRRNFETPSGPNASLVESLQRRHEGMHALQDRIEELERSMEETIADVEMLAATSTQLKLNAALSGTEADRLLDHLSRDLDVLAKVHDDLADL